MIVVANNDTAAIRVLNNDKRKADEEGVPAHVIRVNTAEELVRWENIHKDDDFW